MEVETGSAAWMIASADEPEAVSVMDSWPPLPEPVQVPETVMAWGLLLFGLFAFTFANIGRAYAHRH